MSDPSARYNEHNRLKALGPNAPDVRYYKGTAFIMEKEEELKAALRAFFNCTQVEPRVISGQMANDTVYDAFKQFKNRHRRGRRPELISRVLVHDLNKGGHLSAQIAGALKNYVDVDPRSSIFRSVRIIRTASTLRRPSNLSPIRTPSCWCSAAA